METITQSSAGRNNFPRQHTRQHQQIIPSQTIEAIRLTARLEDLIAERIQLRRSGKILVGSCPWHQSKSGRSFTVYPEQQSWRCWGCAIGGDVFDFFERFAGLSFPAAVKLVAKLVGVDIDGNHASPDTSERISAITELGQIEKRIKEILDGEFTRVARKYDSARRFERRVRNRLLALYEGAPESFCGEWELSWFALADSVDRLRRIDVEYTFLAFGKSSELEKFCAADTEVREQWIDAFLDDGVVMSGHGRVFEVPA